MAVKFLDRARSTRIALGKTLLKVKTRRTVLGLQGFRARNTYAVAHLASRVVEYVARQRSISVQRVRAARWGLRGRALVVRNLQKYHVRIVRDVFKISGVDTHQNTSVRYHPAASTKPVLFELTGLHGFAVFNELMDFCVAWH